MFRITSKIFPLLRLCETFLLCPLKMNVFKKSKILPYCNIFDISKTLLKNNIFEFRVETPE